MITLDQAHEQGHTSFPIVSAPREEQALGDWIKTNTYLRKSMIADHLAECVTGTKVPPSELWGQVYHCYRPTEADDLAGMFMIELRRIALGHPTETVDHIALRTMMVDGTEYIVFGTDYDIKNIDMSEFSKENAATVDDLRMWMSVYRGDGSQGEILFRQLRDFLKLHNLTPHQVEFVRGNALRHPREGRGGLIKLDMRPKGVKDMVLATLRFETSFLTFDQRQILEAEGFSIGATRLLYEMNTPPTPTDTATHTEQPAQEAEMALEENKATVNDTKAAEAAPQQSQQEAGRAQPERKKEESGPVLVPLENGSPTSLQFALEWLEGQSVQQADREYFKALLDKVCKMHDVEPELIQFAFVSVKHASLLGTKNRHSDELSSELGLVDMAVLVPVVGKPLGMMQLGSLLTFTTTAEWETHVRIGSEAKQVEKLLYLTDPTLRQTQYLAVNRVDSLNFGASALMVLTNTASAREVQYIERLWYEIQRRYSHHQDLDRRLASQVVIKFERMVSPSLRSNHTLERGLIKGKVYSPGADSKLLFGFDVYTELESIDQGKLSECIGAFEVELPNMGPPPVFEPLSARTKAMGGKTMDVGSAANPIPDTEAPKTDPATLFKDTSKYETPTSVKGVRIMGESETIRQPVIVRQNWKESPKISEAPAVNMMQAGKSLRYIELFEDVIGRDEFVEWLHKNLTGNASLNVTDVLTTLKVTSGHFFEIVGFERPTFSATMRYPTDVVPGQIRVRAFDPDRANSEVGLSLLTAARSNVDFTNWDERIVQIATPTQAVLQGHATPEARPMAANEVDQTNCVDTNIWIFFNHVMGGITELLTDDDDKDRVRDAVEYIDRLYHCKGENTERYSVMYDPSRGVLNLTVVEERNNKKVVEIELQVV
jgi:hypothetical protein